MGIQFSRYVYSDVSGIRLVSLGTHSFQICSSFEQSSRYGYSHVSGIRPVAGRLICLVCDYLVHDLERSELGESRWTTSMLPGSLSSGLCAMYSEYIFV